MLINAKNVVDFYNAKAQKAKVYNGTELAKELGLDYFFPETTVRGLTANWIKGGNGKKAILEVCDLDTNAKLAGAVEVSKVSADIPFFKNSSILPEFLRQELALAEETGNQLYIAQVTANILTGFTNLISNAKFTANKLRAEALETGKIVLKGDNAYFTYNYNRANKDVNCTVNTDNLVEKVTAQMDAIEDTSGVRPTIAILSPQAIRKLSTCAEILAMYPNKTIATKLDIEGFFYSMFNLDVMVPTENKLFKNASIILVPREALGNAMFGTTPAHVAVEQADPRIDAELVDGKIAVQIVAKDDPLQTIEIVSMACIPSFERVNATGVVGLK